ncbi:MAG: SH3 domain-containing protein [Clostridium sp.]
MDIRNKNVIDSMYHSDLWIKLCKRSKSTLLTEEEIEKINEDNIEKGYIKDIFKEEELTKESIEENIRLVSKRPEVDRYRNGTKLCTEYYDKLEENMNLNDLRDCKVEYGIVVKRGKLKTFPTSDRVFKEAKDYELDRFMESAVYIGEPCAIYSSSRDGKWYFCKTFNCSGWLHSDYIAIGSKDEVQAFSKSKEFIVVTGRKFLLGYNPFTEALSEESLDMGVRLPLEKDWERDEVVYDMYTEGSYIVKYPTRDRFGKLQLTHILIPFNEEVHEGYLKCKRYNVLRQAFKFQGERYGWGGEFEGRDCSSMIVDIFRCFGIYFPRNTGEQLKKSVGKTIYFDENTQPNEKIKIIESLRPGALIYLSGHVAMVVGRYKDKVYIIHDVIGVHIEEDGELIYLPIRGVTVNSLSNIYTSDKVNYIDAIIGVKDIF